ncbi:MAG: hypothetical protein AAFR65_01390 [Pseudomonadota bacterium]
MTRSDMIFGVLFLAITTLVGIGFFSFASLTARAPDISSSSARVSLNQSLTSFQKAVDELNRSLLILDEIENELVEKEKIVEELSKKEEILSEIVGNKEEEAAQLFNYLQIELDKRENDQIQRDILLGLGFSIIGSGPGYFFGRLRMKARNQAA